MYPKTEDELRGWTVHAFSLGATHNVVYADNSTIAWGSGCQSGELGFGKDGKKSSSNPAKVEALSGIKVAQIGCGVANTILLVEGDATVDKLPEFTPAEGEAAAEAEAEEPAKPKGGKRAAEPAAGKKAAAGKKKAKA